MVNGFSANKAETAGSICVLMYIVFSYLHTVLNLHTGTCIVPNCKEKSSFLHSKFLTLNNFSDSQQVINVN